MVSAPERARLVIPSLKEKSSNHPMQPIREEHTMQFIKFLIKQYGLQEAVELQDIFIRDINDQKISEALRLFHHDQYVGVLEELKNYDEALKNSTVSCLVLVPGKPATNIRIF